MAEAIIPLGDYSAAEITSAASPRPDTQADLRDHCSSCQWRDDWDLLALQHLPFQTG